MTIQRWLGAVLLISLVSQPVLAQDTKELDTPILKRPKIGLALGGGGGRGGAHVGVLKVLNEAGIPIDYIAGTSFGALIGGLYASGIKPNEIKSALLEGRSKRAFPTGMHKSTYIKVGLNVSYAWLLGKQIYPGLHHDSKLYKLIQRKTKGSFESLSIPLQVITVDLVKGEIFPISTGDLGLAIQASTALPGVRAPIPYGDRVLVDGGVLENVPVDHAYKMGSDIVIAVDVDGKTDPIDPETLKSIPVMMFRVIDLQLRRYDTYQTQKADWVIKPGLQHIEVTDLDEKSMLKAEQEGEKLLEQLYQKLKKHCATGKTHMKAFPAIFHFVRLNNST